MLYFPLKNLHIGINIENHAGELRSKLSSELSSELGSERWERRLPLSLKANLLIHFKRISR